MGSIPKIQVYQKKAPARRDPSRAGKVCVIGAFDTELTGPQLCKNLDEAQVKLGSTANFDGCTVLPWLFGKNTGVSVDSIIGVNITTYDTSGDEPVPEKEITTTKLTNALASVKTEKFDMVYVAGTLTDDFIPIITEFAKERFLNKMAIGYTGAVVGANQSAYAATAALLDDYCYGIIPNQTLKINGNSTTLLETSAYYTALVASTIVGNSLTQKTLPNVNGLGTEYTFEDSDIGKALVVMGYTVFQTYDRENEEYVIVNSEQPNGLDLYINRVRDYVAREMSLHRFLGDKTNAVTLNAVKQECNRIRNQCINMGFLEDIIYRVVKVNSHCFEIYIDSLLFAGVLTDINVYMTIEVE